jgi:hypothetical protein
MKYKVMSISTTWGICVSEMSKLSHILDKCGFEIRILSINQYIATKSDVEILFEFITIEGIKASPNKFYGFNGWILHTVMEGGLKGVLDLMPDEIVEHVKPYLEAAICGTFEVMKNTISIKIRDQKTVMFEPMVIEKIKEID